MKKKRFVWSKKGCVAWELLQHSNRPWVLWNLCLTLECVPPVSRLSSFWLKNSQAPVGQLSQQGACYTNVRTPIWIIMVNQDTSRWTQAGLWRSLAGQSVSELGFMRNPVSKQGGKQWRMWFLMSYQTHVSTHIYPSTDMPYACIYIQHTCNTHKEQQ